MRVEDVTRGRGMRSLDREIALAERSGDVRTIVSAYVRAAGWCFDNEQLGKARGYADRAINAARSGAGASYLPATLRAVASMYRSTGVERDIAISQRLANEAVITSEDQGNEREIAASHLEAGRAALAAGQADSALEHLEIAFRLQERLGLGADAARSLALLAEATARGARTPDWTSFSGQPYYADTVAVRQAVRLYDDAINRLRSSGDQPELRRSLYNLGTVYTNLDEHQRATPLYKEAVLLTQALDGDGAATSLACKVRVSFQRSDGQSVNCAMSAMGAISMLTEEDEEHSWQGNFEQALADADTAPPEIPAMLPGFEPSLATEEDDELSPEPDDENAASDGMPVLPDAGGDDDAQ